MRRPRSIIFYAWALFAAQLALVAGVIAVVLLGGLIVHGDADQLDRVVVNLLPSAVQYTPKGGQVRAALAGEGDSAVLTVADTGFGIPAQDQPALFTRFSARPTRSPGRCPVRARHVHRAHDRGQPRGGHQRGVRRGRGHDRDRAHRAGRAGRATSPGRPGRRQPPAAGRDRPSW